MRVIYTVCAAVLGIGHTYAAITLGLRAQLLCCVLNAVASGWILLSGIVAYFLFALANAATTSASFSLGRTASTLEVDGPGAGGGDELSTAGCNVAGAKNPLASSLRKTTGSASLSPKQENTAGNPAALTDIGMAEPPGAAGGTISTLLSGLIALDERPSRGGGSSERDVAPSVPHVRASPSIGGSSCGGGGPHATSAVATPAPSSGLGRDVAGGSPPPAASHHQQQHHGARTAIPVGSSNALHHFSSAADAGGNNNNNNNNNGSLNNDSGGATAGGGGRAAATQHGGTAAPPILALGVGDRMSLASNHTRSSLAPSSPARMGAVLDAFTGAGRSLDSPPKGVLTPKDLAAARQASGLANGASVDDAFSDKVGGAMARESGGAVAVPVGLPPAPARVVVSPSLRIHVVLAKINDALILGISTAATVATAFSISQPTALFWLYLLVPFAAPYCVVWGAVATLVQVGCGAAIVAADLSGAAASAALIPTVFSALIGTAVTLALLRVRSGRAGLLGVAALPPPRRRSSARSATADEQRGWEEADAEEDLNESDLSSISRSGFPDSDENGALTWGALGGGGANSERGSNLAGGTIPFAAASSGSAGGGGAPGGGGGGRFTVHTLGMFGATGTGVSQQLQTDTNAALELLSQGKLEMANAVVQAMVSGQRKAAMVGLVNRFRTMASYVPGGNLIFPGSPTVSFRSGGKAPVDLKIDAVRRATVHGMAKKTSGLSANYGAVIAAAAAAAALHAASGGGIPPMPREGQEEETMSSLSSSGTTERSPSERSHSVRRSADPASGIGMVGMLATASTSVTSRELIVTTASQPAAGGSGASAAHAMATKGSPLLAGGLLSPAPGSYGDSARGRLLDHNGKEGAGTHTGGPSSSLRDADNATPLVVPLASRHAAVLVVSVSMPPNVPPQQWDVRESFQQLLTLCEECVSGTRGALMPSVDDAITVSWGAMQFVSEAASIAVHCGMSLVALAEQRSIGAVHVGVAYGTVHSGTFGLGQFRTVRLMGEPVVRAQALMRLSASLRLSCLIDSRSADRCMASHVTRPVDFVCFTENGAPQIVNEVLGVQPGVEVDEWMYQLKRMKDLRGDGLGNGEQAYDLAFEAFIRNDLGKALVQIDKHLQKQPTDSYAAQFKRRIEKCIRDNGGKMDLRTWRYW